MAGVCSEHRAGPAEFRRKSEIETEIETVSEAGERAVRRGVR